MTRRRAWPDPIALGVVASAVMAGGLGAGFWSPLVGTFLLGFGTGYLLLRGAAHTVSGIVVRLGLYVGSSLAISALVGLAIATANLPLTYESFASAYLLIVVLLFGVQELLFRGRPKAVPPEPQGQPILRAGIVKGLGLVALPFLASWVLLATAPVRSPSATELYFVPAVGQIRDLPTTYDRRGRINLLVIARLAPSATPGVIQVFVADQLVESWTLAAGVVGVDKIVSVDASRIAASMLRIEARLQSPGHRDVIVWLNLTEAASEDTPP